MTLRALSLLTTIFATLALAAPATAQSRELDDYPPHLAVTGSAQLDVAPDQVRVTFAVESEAESVDKAMRDNTRRMNDVFDALKKAGIEEDDLETTGFSIRPQYDRNRNISRENGGPRIVGYVVVNSVVAKTTRLEMAGELIETGVDAGANRVSGLSFGLQNPQDHRAEAIRQATMHAKSDAEALAQAAGVRLVQIIEVTLDPQQDYTPRYELTMSADARGGGAPPISPGEVSLSARVQMVYEIQRADQ
jgi:hypothetical protein